jgi:hypothetical protein
MVHDADTLKPIMASYLEQLSRILEQNTDDINELARVYTKINADRLNLIALETKISEQIGYVRNALMRRNEIKAILDKSITYRK